MQRVPRAAAVAAFVIPTHNWQRHNAATNSRPRTRSWPICSRLRCCINGGVLVETKATVGCRRGWHRRFVITYVFATYCFAGCRSNTARYSVLFIISGRRKYRHRQWCTAQSLRRIHCSRGCGESLTASALDSITVVDVLPAAAAQPSEAAEHYGRRCLIIVTTLSTNHGGADSLAYACGVAQ